MSKNRSVINIVLNYENNVENPISILNLFTYLLQFQYKDEEFMFKYIVVFGIPTFVYFVRFLYGDCFLLILYLKGASAIFITKNNGFLFIKYLKHDFRPSSFMLNHLLIRIVLFQFDNFCDKTRGKFYIKIDQTIELSKSTNSLIPITMVVKRNVKLFFTIGIFFHLQRFCPSILFYSDNCSAHCAWLL